MASLIKEKAMINESYDVEIDLLNNELANINAPQKVELKKMQQEQDFYKGEQEKLSIHAPKDGLIGNIHCLEGENKSSFSTLITFYERNPTLVKGYVHENLIVHVEVGDTLEVSSSLHPEHKRHGVVAGLGSRIVEVPERLRKIPELKTYGREVLIQIPPDNPFLQKEKVVLNFLNPDEVAPTKLIPFPSKKNTKLTSQEAAVQQ